MVSRTPSYTLSAGAIKRKPGFAGYTWVYVVCWQQRGPCKIGVANTPHARLNDLQVANPYKLHIWRAYGFKNCGEAFTIEGSALNRLRGVRMQGEWVNATVNQASDAVLEACAHYGWQPHAYNKQAVKAAKQKLRKIKQAPHKTLRWRDATTEFRRNNGSI